MPTLPPVKGAGQGKAEYCNNFLLLDAVVATADQRWAKVGRFRTFRFEVSGIVAGDVITVYGDMDDGSGVPADTSHGEPLEPTLIANGFFEFDGRVDFMKARLTASAGGGTVSLVAKGTW